MRVAYARELVAAGHRPAVVARILRISRQAVYRIPRPRKPPDAARRPPVDEVEAAIVEVAEANPTDGYRIVTAWVAAQAGPGDQPQAGAAGDARAQADPAPHARAQAPPARVLPGRAARPAMASRHDVGLGRRARLGLSERDHRLLHPRDRRLAALAALPRRRGDRRDRDRGREQGILPGTLTLGHRQRLGVHRPRHAAGDLRARRSLIAAAATATPRARRSSNRGSATSRNAASGATSSRPSTRPGR